MTYTVHFSVSAQITSLDDVVKLANMIPAGLTVDYMNIQRAAEPAGPIPAPPPAWPFPQSDEWTEVVEPVADEPAATTEPTEPVIDPADNPETGTEPPSVEDARAAIKIAMRQGQDGSGRCAAEQVRLGQCDRPEARGPGRVHSSSGRAMRRSLCVASREQSIASLLLVCAAIAGYVTNIVKLSSAMGLTESVLMMMARIIGVLVPPFGALIGYI